jgi:hypothetical protein
MRVLVTGSRGLPSSAMPIVRQALTEVTADHQGPHTLVHGGARGADQMAAYVAGQLGWALEEHPADWSAPCRDTCRHNGRQTNAGGREYCPSAGARRNQAMVDLGADVCVALYARGEPTKGTADAIRRAGKAGISVRRYAA